MSQELQKQINSQNSLTQYNEQNPLIGDWVQGENEYAIALTYSDKKIGDYNREDMARLVEVMAQWRILLGVTSDSTEQELVIICQFVYDNFKKYTLGDIKLAMNWVISGKVDVGFVSQKNISSYYVSRALNAYDEEKRRIYNKMMYEREKHLHRLEMESKKKQTPSEKANDFKELILTMYDSYKKSGLFVDFGDFVYNWLKRSNLISRDNTVINAAVTYGREKYFEEIQEKKKFNPAAVIEPETKEFRQKKLARHYMIIHYFDSINVSGIIKAIKIEHFQD